MKEIRDAIHNVVQDKEVKEALYYFASHLGDVSRKDADSYLKGKKLSIKRLEEIESELLKKGILERSSIFLGSFNSSISPTSYLTVMQLMSEDKESRVVKEHDTYAFSVEAKQLYDIFVRGGKFNGRTKLTDLSRCGRWMPLLCTLFLFPQYYDVCTKMPDGIFMRLLCTTFQYVETYGEEYDTEDLRNFLNSTYVTSRGTDVKEAVSLFKYIYFGEKVDGLKPSTMFGYIQRALSLAYAEEYERSVESFDRAWKLFCKNTYALSGDSLSDFPFSASVICFAHIIAARNVRDARLSVLSHYSRLRFRYISTARTLGSYFLNPTEPMPKDGLKEMLSSDDRNAWYFSFLFQAYDNGAWDSDCLMSLPVSALLRFEFSQIFPIEKEEMKKYNEVYGAKTLLWSIPHKALWERMLEHLEAECEARAVKEVRKNARLYYEIDGGRVNVRQQTILKSGAWSSGKVLPYSRFTHIDARDVREEDIRIVQKARLVGQYGLTVENLLPFLVDSDRVGVKTRYGTDPARVIEEKPFVVVEKNPQGFRLKSNFNSVDAQTEIYKNSTCTVVRRAPDLYVVIQMTESERSFYDSLMKIGQLPLVAEVRLKSFLQKIQKVVNVYSDDFADDMQVETVDASTVVSLQVTRNGGGFLVHHCVRLIAGGDDAPSPGDGLAVVTVNVKNNRYWAKRDLQKEKENYRELLDFYNSIEVDTDDEEPDVFLFVDEFLQLADYVHSHPEKFSMEWKEGEALKLLQPKSDVEWDIHLNRNKAGWFELEGDITLDDDKVVSMSELLALLSESNGRFIRLNNDEYIVLSDNLRKQMSKMEGVMVRNRGKLQLPAVQAGLLTDDVLDGEIKIKCDSALAEMRERVKKSASITPRVPKGLNATLRDYQLEGFRWMARLNNWGAGACLADDMGLGKTIQTIAYLLYKASAGASLVVAPASVVPNWSKELERFAPSLHVRVLNRASNREECIKNATKNDVVLSTYGLLVPNEKVMAGKMWNVVCLDEAHIIKNRDTKTSGVAMQLQAKNKVILTGTPVQNHLGELWNLFQFINPYLLGSYEQFQQRFIAPIELYNNKERQEQLNTLVHPFMLRRTKLEVVNELPDKEEIVIPVELSDDELAIYEALRRRAKELVAMGGSKVSVATLAEITKLRQAACCAQLVEKKWTGGSSKVDRLMELMQELRENGHRALIFSQFTSFFAIIREALDKEKIPYLYLDGSVPMKKREEMVHEFQEGDCPFFLISLKAGGLGLNLTGANYVIHLDPWWNPAIEQQATDRAYRIGQTQKVTAYHLVSSHTIEEKILRLHETKRNLSDAVLSGIDACHKITADELMEILSLKQNE